MFAYIICLILMTYIFELNVFYVVGARTLLYITYALSSPIIKIVSIDGNIGSGKSTLLNIMKSKIGGIVIVQEPVDMWIRTIDNDGKNILQKFYDDKQRWSYTFQNYAYITRLHKIEQCVNNIKYFKWNPMLNVQYRLLRRPIIVITERSILTDKYVFAQMLIDSNDMSMIEQDMYNTWFNYFSEKYKIDKIIYIKNEPLVSDSRIKKRGRVEENTIKMDYLNALHNYHNSWISKMHEKNDIDILILDTNEEFENNTNIGKHNLRTHMHKIQMFLDC